MSEVLLRQVGNQITPTMKLVAFERRYSDFIKTMNSMNEETLSHLRGEALDLKEGGKLFNVMLLFKLLKFLNTDYLALALLIKNRKDQEMQIFIRNILLLYTSIKNNSIVNADLQSVFKMIYDNCFDSIKTTFEDFTNSLAKVVKPAYAKQLYIARCSSITEASLVS
jgi:hypothetical protein